MPTKIPGFDELVQGGIPRGSVVLVSGSPGTGKTLFCLQTLINGCEDGEKGLFISFEQNIKDIIKQAKNFGWPIEKHIENGNLIVHTLSVFSKEELIEYLANTIQEHNISRLCIDSLTALEHHPMFLFGSEKLNALITGGKIRFIQHERVMLRLMVHLLINTLKRFENLTSFLISEVPSGTNQLSSDGISEFLCDGVILMSLHKVLDVRRLEIVKLRGVQHSLKTKSFKITDKGVTVGD